MKNAAFCCLAGLVLGITSCQNHPAQQNPAHVAETPGALQDHASEIKSYTGRDMNLVDELYREMVGKSPNLKELEADLETLRSGNRVPIEAFQHFDSKSQDYYNAAARLSKSIEDSVLRVRTEALLEKSLNQYKERCNQYRLLIDAIEKNDKRITDTHTVLELILTLPLIEKYQSESMPDKTPFLALQAEQKKLMLALENMMKH